MSSQGTGSIRANDFEWRLLDAWGIWSRSGNLGLGYSSGYAPLELLTKTSNGIPFSDDEMLTTDGVICRLEKWHRSTIEKAFKHNNWEDVGNERVGEAVAAFAESLREGITS